MSRWWRAHDEAVDDPKLILLSDKQHRAWFNLCCITSQNGGALPNMNVVAVKLRLNPAKAKAMVAELAALGLVDVTETRATMHNWDGRQFKSDTADPTAPERNRAYRKRISDRNATVTLTPTREQNTEAETDKSSLRSDSAPAKSVRRSSAKAALPACWQLDEQDYEHAVSLGFAAEKIGLMATAFADHHRAKGSLMADWHAAWRTWSANEIKFRGSRTHGNSNGKRTVHDAAKDLADRLAAFDEPAPGELRGGPGEAAFRLIPTR